MSVTVLAVHSERCTGCRLCEEWCSQHHHGSVNPARARVYIRRDHVRMLNEVIACAHCDLAPCIEACPESAIRRDPLTYGLLLDEETCMACSACVDACPTGVIRMDTVANFPLLCDLCGGSPQCAAHCPEGAIALEIREA
jgi:carbon-monoxide dehydrogenase iron sulfur subunit